ncbi:phage virion morphogenesis protein [Iodobacter arcticus]|uniref:Phage virion morphogenesis protein n=1 Tax=Iodobacter arcticus TaxID=590593 RepID=A0ABW2R037_9NEIS
MIQITLTEAAVRRALANVQSAAINMRPVFKDIGEHLTNTTIRRFDEGRGPDGEKWALNSILSTLNYKEGDRPLIGETHSLSNEIHYEADSAGVMVGSSKVQAAMMQFGGKKSEFPHLWGDIPARPFLGVSSEDEREILDLSLDHLTRAALR